MKLNKEVTKEISNQADKTATTLDVNDIKEDDNAIFVTLLDADSKTIATNRVYTFENFPCTALTYGEKELVKGNQPDDKWLVSEIKLWLDSKQTKDEDGVVLKDDPYVYPSDALKADLLLIANPAVA